MSAHPTITEFKKADWRGNKLQIPCSVAANPSVWKYDIHGDLIHVQVDMRIISGESLHLLILTAVKPFTGEVRGL